MKIKLGNRLEIRRAEDRVIEHLRLAGYGDKVEAFIADFQEFLSKTDVVEMHVFLGPADIQPDALGNPVLIEAVTAIREQILAKIERAGFCIGITEKAKKKARPHRQIAPAAT